MLVEIIMAVTPDGHRTYVRGEKAEIADDLAKRYIKAGIAKPAEDAPKLVKKTAE